MSSCYPVSVAYLGALVRGPPPFGRTAVIFVTILFAAGAPPRTPPGELTALPQRCQVANLFTADSRRAVPAR